MDRKPYVTLALTAEQAARLAKLFSEVTQLHDLIGPAAEALAADAGSVRAPDLLARIRTATVQANARTNEIHQLLNEAAGVFGGPIQ